MKQEPRRCAEDVLKIVMNDLRFADAKALFVGVVVGGWTAAIYAEVHLSDSTHCTEVKTLSVLFLVAVVASLTSALATIYPRWPTRVSQSVHQIASLSRIYRFDKDTVNSLAYAFEDHQYAPGSAYDSSLLTEIARVGHRCVQKYWCVRFAVIFGFFAFALGGSLLVEQLFAAPATATKALIENSDLRLSETDKAEEENLQEAHFTTRTAPAYSLFKAEQAAVSPQQQAIIDATCPFGKPILMQRASLEGPVEYFEWERGTLRWNRLDNVSNTFNVQPPPSSRAWLAQLALPLSDSRRSCRECFGVAWIFWSDGVRPIKSEMIDPAWACYCADRVALAFVSLPLYLSEAERVAHLRTTERISALMSSIRHDMLGKGSMALKAELERISDMIPVHLRDDVKLLGEMHYSLIDIYASYYLDDFTGYISYGKTACDIRNILEVCKRYVNYIEKPFPEIAIEIEGSGEQKCGIPLGENELVMIIMNLLANSKQAIVPHSDIHKSEPIKVKALLSNQNLAKVEIDDAGRGMTASERTDFGKIKPLEDRVKGARHGIGGSICRLLLGTTGQLNIESPNSRGGTTVSLIFNEQP